MSYLSDLKDRRTEVAALIKSLTTDGLNLPNEQGGGQRPDFTGKIKSLYDELAMLNDLICQAEPGIVETYEIP